MNQIKRLLQGENRIKVKRLGWGDTYAYIWLGLGLELGLTYI